MTTSCSRCSTCHIQLSSPSKAHPRAVHLLHTDELSISTYDQVLASAHTVALGIKLFCLVHVDTLPPIVRTKLSWPGSRNCPAQGISLTAMRLPYYTFSLPTCSFGHDTMPIRNLFKNCSYYYGFAAYVAYFVNHPAYTAPNETLSLVCFALAMVCQFSNYRYLSQHRFIYLIMQHCLHACE
jgi:hypothetical protein